MTQATNPTSELEFPAVEGMDNTKLKRIVELLIQLDNDRIKAEREEKAKEELKE